MNRILILFTALFLSLNSFSQEFKVNVSVNSQVQGQDRRIYDNMQTALNEFVNSRKWTKFNYKTEEKIEGTISITIRKNPSQDNYEGDLNIQLRRPVYNSSYTTTLLNWQENDFFFTFVETANLEFEENTYYDNLTSTLGFYLYYFLALDANTFSLNGGREYFKTMQNIVSAAQKSAQKGWKSFETPPKNKYWISENYNNSAYRYIHDAWYLYHRMGLDMMSTDAQSEARNNIFSALESLQKVHREKINLICVQHFLDAKADEIINIYKGAPENEKERVIKLMSEINPVNTSRYEQIRQTNNQNTNKPF